jgi:hypothetical protein
LLRSRRGRTIGARSLTCEQDCAAALRGRRSGAGSAPDVSANIACSAPDLGLCWRMRLRPVGERVSFRHTRCADDPRCRVAVARWSVRSTRPIRSSDKFISPHRRSSPPDHRATATRQRIILVKLYRLMLLPHLPVAGAGLPFDVSANIAPFPTRKGGIGKENSPRRPPVPRLILQAEQAPRSRRSRPDHRATATRQRRTPAACNPCRSTSSMQVVAPFSCIRVPATA